MSADIAWPPPPSDFAWVNTKAFVSYTRAGSVGWMLWCPCFGMGGMNDHCQWVFAHLSAAKANRSDHYGAHSVADCLFIRVTNARGVRE